MQGFSRVYFWSMVIAIGGFLFGFDTAVISGAEQAIQHYWGLSVFEHGLTISIALIGTVIGALLGGIPADRFGRRTTLVLIAILYLLSSLGTAFSVHWITFLFFRFCGGLGVGASSVTAPIYISEIAPAKSRGKLVGLFQFNVVLGILLAYLSNYFLGRIGQDSWRFMLGIQAIPSLAFLILLRFIPESPRWLILKKGQVEKARDIIAIVHPAQTEKIVQDILRDRDQGSIFPKQDSLWNKKYRGPVVFAMLIAFFNQVSGINAIIYFAPRIFEMTGLGKSASLLSTAGIGLVNFIFTLIAINVIDRFGRRKLMILGSIGLIATLGMVSRTFFVQDFSSWAILIYLLLFIAFFALSQGAVIWVFIAEIFPNQVRAKGQALGSFTHWLMAALITFFFPFLAQQVGGGKTFLFFTGMMVLQLVFAVKFMPETKGKSLEEIESFVLPH
ncbi:MAG: sugar porter family MFS transporter [Chitinophagaceae bacterium]